MGTLMGIDFEAGYYIMLAIFVLLFFLALIIIRPFKTAVLIIIISLFVYTVIKKFISMPQYLQNAMLYIDELFCILLFVSVLLRQFLTKSIRLGLLEVCLFGFIAIGLVSSLINAVPIYIATMGLLLLIKGYLLFWAISNIEIVPKNIALLFRVLKIFGWIFLFFGVIDFIFPSQFRTITINSGIYETRFGITSVISLFTLSSVFGWFMSTIGLLYAAEYFVKRDTRCLFKSIPFFIFVILSMRLKPILATSIALLWFIFFIRHTLKNKFNQRIIVMILICVIGILFFDEITGLFIMQKNKYLNPSVSRSALYLGSFEVAKDYFPLGAGFGRYGGYIASCFYSPLYFKYGINKVYGLSEEGHFLNDTFWPCILGETGYIGLLLYLLCLFQIYLILRYLIKTPHTEIYKTFVVFCFPYFYCRDSRFYRSVCFHKESAIFLNFLYFGHCQEYLYFFIRDAEKRGDVMVSGSPVITFFVDGLKPDSVQYMPFLNSLQSRLRIKTDLGYSITCHATMYSGVYPDKHKMWFLWKYSPQTSPFRFLKNDQLNNFIDSLPTRYFIGKMTRLFSSNNSYGGLSVMRKSALRNWKYFDLSECCFWSDDGYLEDGIKTIFEILREHGISYETIGLYDSMRHGGSLTYSENYTISERSPRWLYFFIGDIDHVSHVYSQDSQEARAILKRVDECIESIYKKCRSIFKEDPVMFCFSDHGHMIVKHKFDIYALFLAHRKPLSKYIHIIDTNYARFWFRDEKEKAEVLDILKKCAGRVYFAG
jgi:Uncharacterized proteins of the AP superfamily